jgi:hypothetical protein
MAIGLAMLSRIRPDGPFTTSVLIPSLIIAVGVGLATVPLYATSTAGITGRTAGIRTAYRRPVGRFIARAGSSGHDRDEPHCRSSRLVGWVSLADTAESRPGRRVCRRRRVVGLLAAAAFAVAGMIIAIITIGRRPGRQRT